MGANTSKSEFLDGLGRGRGRGRGSSLLVKQNPNDAGNVVWGDFAFDVVAGGTVAAICLSADGSLTYKPAATGSDNKLYLNAGLFYARLSAIGRDKLVGLSADGLVAA